MGNGQMTFVCTKRINGGGLHHHAVPKLFLGKCILKTSCWSSWEPWRTATSLHIPPREITKISSQNQHRKTQCHRALETPRTSVQDRELSNCITIDCNSAIKSDIGETEIRIALRIEIAIMTVLIPIYSSGNLRQLFELQIFSKLHFRSDFTLISRKILPKSS